MSPSARCVYGCEKLREWGEGGVLRFLGAKQPSGMALKLLSIVKKHGLQVLA
jgi:DNA-binding transcriptional regulator YiaG